MYLNSTTELLISGGDKRLELNAHGVNKYGCSPTPDDAILSFSSSTASTISIKNFSVADTLRNRLEHALQTTSAEMLYSQEITRQKNAWRELIGLATETQLIFSPSGTDLHALVAHYVAPNTLIIMVDGNETGSGVEMALKQGQNVEVVSIALRFDDGLPRAISIIDADVLAQVARAMEQQRDVLLIVADQSKTGMIAPSPDCAMQLKNQYKLRLNVLVDACQFRLSATTLNAYLQHDFMIALTGSKFLAAPSFSAILLLPAPLRMAEKSEAINWGLLLRMEIALGEYRAFHVLTDAQISEIIRDFADAVQNYLSASPHFEPLETPVLNRGNLVETPMWDNLRTIFPFILLRGNKPLSRAETLACYQELPLQNPRCQMGQPVMCGNEQSALRLCLSAPLIVQAAKNKACRRDMIQNALQVLATLETLVQFQYND